MPFYSADFIKEMPKSDLHLHLDGSLRLESLLEMAKRRFCVNPDPALTTRAERNAWPIYQWNLIKDAV